MPTLHPFESQVSAAWPVELWQEVSVLVAVSGGADSVALLRAVSALKRNGAGKLIVAHFHHGLRGPEADADAAFVAELAGKLGLELESGKADVAALSRLQGDGIEATAREARYEFLRAAAERRGARYVATGHTADDQAETVLHRILRGTGIGGLAGMRRFRPLGAAVVLARPLLELSRDEARAYLSDLGQSWREDSSNAGSDYTRSRIRNELLPLLARQYNPGVREALLRLAAVAGERNECIADLVGSLREQAVEVGADEQVRIDCSRLAACSPHLVRELLVHVWSELHWPRQEMGYTEWTALAALIQSAPPRAMPSQTLPGGIIARREGDAVILIAPRPAAEQR